ncbi:MAG TPA: CoA transferase [Candidatus Binataceae bacterium]|nr:CoA transferase [Candidatus Binataceae bacterium]
MSDLQDAMLAGLKVLDCGENVSAPYAAKLMADLGAEVVKVEPPLVGDVARSRGPWPREHEGDREHSGLFLALNTSKRGVTIDLANRDGRAVLDRLAKHADVLIHNYTPARAKSLGLDFERLSALNDQLVVTQITVYGLTGPKSEWAAHNLNGVAAGGWLYMSPGYSKDTELPPLKTFGQQGDFQGGIHGAIASMSALFARRAIGRGQLVDVSIQEAIAAALELGFVKWTYRGEISHRCGTLGPSAPYGILRCKDGLLHFLILEDAHWQGLVKIMGAPEWTTWDLFKTGGERALNQDVLEMQVEEWLKDYTVQEVYEMARKERLPIAPVSGMGNLLKMEQLKVRGYFTELDHPAAGKLTYPGAPFKLNTRAWGLRRPAPLLGQHNREVFAEIGVAGDELVRLERAGAI